MKIKTEELELLKKVNDMLENLLADKHQFFPDKEPIDFSKSHYRKISSAELSEYNKLHSQFINLVKSYST